MTQDLASPDSASPAASDADVDYVLFVDDEKPILSSIQRLLRKQDFKCLFAESGADGLKILESQRVDLVISDMRMPNMDGAQFLSQVKARWPLTVRMLLTGHSDISATVTALNEGGIYRYISKPWDDENLIEVIHEGLRIRRLEREKKRLLNVTQQQNRELQKFNKDLEKMVAARTEEVRQTADMLELAYQQLKDSYDDFVRVFSTFITSRGYLIKGHSQSVADLSKTIAEAMALPEADVKHIYYAGLLHEVGKLSLSDDVLSRAEAKLTRQDAVEYQRYPLLGEMALTAIAELEPTSRFIRHHTEYMDGSGFPDRLKGDAIPIGSRIIRAVRDFVGLQSGLMRTDAMTKDDAFKLIQDNAGKRYDAQVVKLLAPLVDSYTGDDVLPHEDKLGVGALVPGMRLSRDLKNTNGILLIAKGHVLTEKIIEKMLSLEKLENRKLSVFVMKR
ncbi:HD domain-containing phosphohydrolase [Hahella sp. HN01]|uniref:HD domain-containing phosphohydrolase n=1 Tax=Hahella sp. HN01 TaxID=2847262 RepID=UPI001C1F191B|nr:HD domain-containing phosphohydrolase [Hahella sp. HN01]MBU6953287.1 response regulator [Hahella sp. HN01]